jgi:hypothetical protein
MFFKTRQAYPLLCGFLMAMALTSCQKDQPANAPPVAESSKTWDRQKAELEYRDIRAELTLAQSEQPYLVIDLKRNQLQLRLKGAAVWSHSFDFAQTDSQRVWEFARRFTGDDDILVRPLSAKFLFAAQEKTPDSILAIVGDVVKADPQLLQRDVPARFSLMWGCCLTLDVRTDVEGKSRSPLGVLVTKFRRALTLPLGQTTFNLQMSGEDALTLYRATRAGMPTLFYLPGG